MFMFAKYTVGMRVTTEMEEVGMDRSKHGGLVDYIYDGTKRLNKSEENGVRLICSEKDIVGPEV